MHSRRKTILRIHGTVLLLLPTGLTIYVTRSRAKGTGVYGFLHESLWGWIGLAQAYMLMSVIGLVLWFGSMQGGLKKWDLIGALAHLPPLAVVIASWRSLTKLGFRSVAIGSLVFHCVFISMELLSALLPDRTKSKRTTERSLIKE
jgi:hypothetical protein